MAQRPTRKAGLPQSRYSDPKLQRSLDAIIERLEVLDGLRGDALDSAITYRDLGLSGFTVINGPTGPYVTNPTDTDGGGGGPGGPAVGPAAAPSNLAAAETFLALLLTWDNPSFNLQHIEVHRADVDNLSLATLIGTTVSPQYVDYVGASASFYYWVRAVGTDGTFSAFNDTAGTLGTTGVDPSDWELNLNISASNLDAALAARIDLIDVGDGILGPIWDRLGTAEGDIVAIDSRTTTLESDLTAANVLISGNTAVTTANASLISTQQTSITQLLSDMGVAQGDISDNTNAVIVNASDILNLQATIGALDSEGGQNWDFLTDTDGWTPSNASLVHGGGPGTGSVLFTPSGANPYMYSGTISISGGIYTQVVARIRRNTSGGTWEGTVRYSTAGHGFGGYSKSIPEPAGLVLGQWQTLTWDMTSVDGGTATDWIDSTITGLQFEIVADAGGAFEIDWIIIAKFSTTAIADAISALDVRVTASEGTITSQGTRLDLVEATVDDPSTGVSATAVALSALTATVATNTSDVSANASDITALEVTVDDPTSGVAANASAITLLEADVSTLDGITTSQTSNITQLVARMSGAYASITNPLTTAGENFGTDYSVAELQAFNVGGRAGVCARIDTDTDVADLVYRYDGERIQVNPNDIYEVKFSVYHNRPTDAGAFYAGLQAYVAASGGSNVAVQAINDRVAGSNSSTPYWLSFNGANHDEEWLDVTCYILGADVDASVCPNMIINGSSGTSGYADFNDGWKVLTGSYVHLRFLNFNSSPTYGDDTTTTTYVTDLQVRRIDSAAENYAALQTQATVTASDVGDLNALYAVNVELNANGIPYVSGFGLAADVINGVASSAFGIRADQFFITSPSNPVDTAVPFGVDLVDGVATVGIRGELIVDGTIRGDSIVANTIGADKINVNQLSALSADMGTLTSGLIRTAPSGYRVEIQDQAATTWPIWYGTGAKSAINGLFYVDQTGGVTVKGLLDAGMIKQSYFAPAGGNNSFRVACDYPANYSGGLYTGAKAHMMPTLTTGYVAPEASEGAVIDVNAPTSQHQCGWHSNSLTFYSPVYAGSTVEYGRLGSLSENLMVRYSTMLMNQFTNQRFWTILKYQYDAEGEKFAFIQHVRCNPQNFNASLVAEELFITRSTPTWDTLSLRIGVGCTYVDSIGRGRAQSVYLSASTANFGYADLGGIVETTGASDGSTVIPLDPDIIRRYD